MGRKSRSTPSEGEGEGKKNKRPSYTAPQVFLDLEEDYKKQGKLIKKDKRKQGKQDEEDSEFDQLASDQDDSGYLSGDGGSGRKNKKRKKSAVKGKKKRTKIEGPCPFVNLPQELLLEIFKVVDHESLFHLSEMNKLFHKLLKPKKQSIIGIWTRAREAVEPELPELFEQMKEKEFAHLLYSDQCCFDKCDNKGEGDPYLRSVFCKSCRKRELFNVTKMSSEYPELMHQAPECCISTFVSASGKLTKTRWVFRSHLEDEAEELLTREQEDLDQAETDKWNEIKEGTSGRKKDKGSINYGCPEYNDKVPKEGTGKRVTKYVEKRKKIVQAFEEEGRELYNWFEKKKDALIKEKEELGNERRQAIEERLLDLEGYSEEDFDDPHWQKHPLITTGDTEIDDEAWEKLEDKVVKVVRHCRKLKEKAQTQARIDARVTFLRSEIYDKIRRGENEYPLFADFCSLPSVVKLLDLKHTTSEKIDMKKWKDLKESIAEEANGWFDEIKLELVKLVLQRTLDLDEGETFSDDPEQYSEYLEDDDWFNLVSSFVCCDIASCQTLSENHQVFFGSLEDLMKHQHDVHSDLAPKLSLTTSNKKQKNSKTQLRFSLPLPLAAAISDILELAGLDETKAMGEDVDRVFTGGTTLQWENAPRVGFGKSKKESDWKKIMSKIKIESDRAEKNEEVLDPSLVIWNVVNGKQKKRKKPEIEQEGEE